MLKLIALILFLTGCESNTFTYSCPLDTADFISGDAIVVMAPDNTPPTSFGPFSCTVDWVGPNTATLHCNTQDKAETCGMVEMLSQMPGVVSVDYNYVRKSFR